MAGSIAQIVRYDLGDDYFKGYADRVRSTLEALLAQGGGPSRATIGFRRDANLIGSAAAALAHQQR